MIETLNPAWILIAGALLVPLLPQRWLTPTLLLLPLAAMLQLCRLPDGARHSVELAGLALTPLRVDALAFVFAAVFLLATGLSIVYALRLRDRLQHAATLVYAGAAVGAVLAGDLFTLFVYWELTSLASVFLIWAQRSPRAYRAGMRYLLVQVASGLLLMTGALVHWHAAGDLDFGHIGLASPGGWLILGAFGIKCAFPLLHGWLQDAYPEATVTGTVVLSIFTTKMAIYALARGYAGTDLLIWVGAAMAAFPIFYAVIENDLRRVLAYSLINQLGFMVVGIGIGTELALNGAVAHACAEILFKSLLFMSMGAVLLRSGTILGSELGGLYKSMPWTTVLCLVGAASISAFPLFSGFVTKSMIMLAVAEEHRQAIWLILLFASAGVFHHAGIKIPYFAFFAHDSGIRCKEAPLHMLVAMAAAAALCIAIGTVPALFYPLLPYAVDYNAYTVTHVVTQLQLLLFSALAFTWLMRTGIYPPELRSVNLDSDWLYRRLGPLLAVHTRTMLEALRAGVGGAVGSGAAYGLFWLRRLYAPGGTLVRAWGTGMMTLWVALLLAAYLLLYYD